MKKKNVLIIIFSVVLISLILFVLATLTIGTNCGFVETSPSSDPNTGDENIIDNLAVGIKATSPATATRITEIGWWCDTATEETNFEVAIYSHDSENDKPDTIIGSDLVNAKGTDAGWKKVTGLNIEISPETIYWIVVQVDDTETDTSTDVLIEPGERYCYNIADTLPDPWEGEENNGFRIGIYAVWEEAEDLDNPTVALNEPADFANYTSATTDLFNCTVFDDVAVDTVLFYWNVSGSWEVNGTNTTGVNNSKYSFSRDINQEGEFHWGCWANDTSGNSTWSSNRTFSLTIIPANLTNISITQTTSLSDLINRDNSFQRLQNQEIIYSDNLNQNISFQRYLTNLLTFNQITSRIIYLDRNQIQTLTISDLINSNRINQRSVLNTFIINQNLKRLLDFSRINHQEVTFTDNILRNLNLFRTQNQELTISETATSDKWIIKSVLNTILLNENIKRILDFSRNQNQVINLEDNTLRNLNFFRNTNQEITTNNIASYDKWILRKAFQTFVITDNINRLIDFSRGINQEITISDISIRKITFSRTINQIIDFFSSILRTIGGGTSEQPSGGGGGTIPVINETNQTTTELPEKKLSKKDIWTGSGIIVLFILIIIAWALTIDRK